MVVPTPASDFPAPEQIKDSPITIWVDADRSAIAEAFQKDNPDVKVKIETYDGNSGGTNSFQTKSRSTTLPVKAGPTSCGRAGERRQLGR